MNFDFRSGNRKRGTRSDCKSNGLELLWTRTRQLKAATVATLLGDFECKMTWLQYIQLILQVTNNPWKQHSCEASFICSKQTQWDGFCSSPNGHFKTKEKWKPAQSANDLSCQAVNGTTEKLLARRMQGHPEMYLEQNISAMLHYQHNINPVIGQ